MLLNLIKVFLPMIVALLIGLFITPLATHFFYKYKMWKKYSRNNVTNLDFQKIHNENEEIKTPRVGGIIIWVSVLFSTLIFYFISVLFPGDMTGKINFLSKNQTLIPLLVLLFGSFLGLWDDLIQIYGKGKIAQDDKSWRKWKALLIVFISFLIGIWFFYKLGMTSISIPFGGEMYLGIFIIPFFIIVSLATFSGGVIDGIDGLSGGVFASIFTAYSVIAFINNQIDIAAFSAVITGAVLSFLWFNIPPARFYMGETGIMGLTITLATISFLTDSILILPIISMPLVISSASVILQILSKKLRGGKKIFILAPIHHHFEALGWPSYKVTMRFWILSIAFSVIGIILAVISK
ncbi:MAG: Phospho-N-acetylmuramoyl-pentapeptide-transferase [Candidatus Nomurabacteria bacterium GW2011_GWE1_32_28]|uniref:Phospho-N-acetylmuramoyl-pentapeptide-transferase n=1 Tax=Candidatus Nomurabacteria bacterium GW2011_GWF1_31_48 TaxID=1618767 RepID=A0A0F9YFR5_9BACT|nr:MAG: Phospho-N-acetylmuramoyl-pentapeptide-transferase [Candidatus Nomurabacteria bacterium GW2011_GWF2_30_133]KKP29026.1 MAG: Phospho-N-acetylmuramoyl-pentapeptide-transferase [Candidatus Nomurabacteria bacterium GW2011_GWE2_31_40]KKP30564.1 MAG: Phospho-N-acetylmuramoyl-pentapeptide-transferase [Candidatus Nomurabacteria bacterium GW2011_GWF1_31_48]KKP35049.1 MAG: Phospho-N-acetylmuramoyl-pentapeptide-transferase [Candidatus Nomurabacteria bacterium GW2011_GWE1_32_28]HAS80586.1 hypothetica